MIRSGSPAREIIRVAEELDVSLIMIARLGLSDYIKNITIGSVAAGVAMHADRPLFMVNPPISLNVLVKELEAREFPLAEELWLGYHQQKADPSLDRVFGVFAEDTLVAAARCRRHPDGLEVDAVYTPEVYRGRGYARRVVRELVDTCGNEPLYMHATLDLIGFYQTFGFTEIPEQELPAGIRERFSFADGDLRGANVSPMKRVPLAITIRTGSEIIAGYRFTGRKYRHSLCWFCREADFVRPGFPAFGQVQERHCRMCARWITRHFQNHVFLPVHW